MSADLKTGANLAGGILASGQVQSGITLTITGTPTGGTFTVSVTTSAGTQTTSGVAYNASAATLQTALQALSNVGAGNLLVTGSAGGPYTVTAPTGFVVSATTASGASLTGGTSPAVVVASVAATIYTVPPGVASAAMVKTAVITSTASAAVAVTGYVVPKGSSLDSTRIVGPNAYSLAAFDATSWSEVANGVYDSTVGQGAFLALSLGGGAINAANYLITGGVNS